MDGGKEKEKRVKNIGKDKKRELKGAKEGLDGMGMEKQVIMDQMRGKRRQESKKDEWVEGMGTGR